MFKAPIIEVSKDIVKFTLSPSSRSGSLWFFKASETQDEVVNEIEKSRSCLVTSTTAAKSQTTSRGAAWPRFNSRFSFSRSCLNSLPLHSFCSRYPYLWALYFYSVVNFLQLCLYYWYAYPGILTCSPTNPLFLLALSTSKLISLIHFQA